MTEQEWLNCREPALMLAEVQTGASQRKLRLLAIAWCRKKLEFIDITDQDLLNAAFDVAERFADGKANKEAIGNTQTAVQCRYREFYEGAKRAEDWIEVCLTDQLTMDMSEPFPPLLYLAAEVYNALLPVLSPSFDFYEAFFSAPAVSELARSPQVLCPLIRDLFVSPGRICSCDPGRFSSKVIAIAKTIYEERRFADMPILADALEEAGCTNADILDHCRRPAEHARGCWAVDLILAKE